jgi:hypothetical protein
MQPRQETRPETRQKSSLDSSGFFSKKQSLSQPEQPQSPPKRKKEDYDEESYGDEEESDSSIDSMLSEEDITDITKNSSSEILHNSNIKLVKQLNDESINSYLDKPQTQLVATQPVVTQPVETQPLVIQPVENQSTPTLSQPIPNKFPSNQQPPNTAPMRNDYYSDTDEEVIDMTDNKLYEVLASVLEDVDGNNVSENMAKTNSYLEKLISIFENQPKHSNSDDAILRMSNAIENQNKLLTRIVDIFEKSTKNNQESPKKKNQDINPGEDINLEEENTNSDNNPNIKRVTIPKIIKESTTVPPSLRHRVQIKKK